MIEEVLNIILRNDLYGVSENVEIAKGKFEKIDTWKECKEKIKRIWRSRGL